MVCRELYDKFTDADPLRPPIPTLNRYYFGDDEPLSMVIGAFDEYGVLSVCVFVIFSKHDRSISIRYVMKHPFADKSMVVGVLEFVANMSRNSNYCKMYISYFNNRAAAWERLLRNSEIFNRYTAVVEEVIPASRKSSFTRYWTEMQGCKISLEPMTIKMYSLKQEFRPIL